VTDAASERLVFAHTVEGLLLRGVAGMLTDKLRTRLRGAGLDLASKLRPAYTYAEWTEFVRLSAEELFPDLPWPAAYRTLGERLIDGYRETLLGRAVMAIVKLRGPAKAIQRTQHSFRSGNNYTEARVEHIDGTSAVLWMNETGDVRMLTAGIIHAALRAAGAQHPLVEVKRFDEAGTTYALKWG
jgi:uncharacterized protein (TIGR02265 family)